jgi:hypothetical protein
MYNLGKPWNDIGGGEAWDTNNAGSLKYVQIGLHLET